MSLRQYTAREGVDGAGNRAFIGPRQSGKSTLLLKDFLEHWEESILVCGDLPRVAAALCHLDQIFGGLVDREIKNRVVTEAQFRKRPGILCSRVYFENVESYLRRLLQIHSGETLHYSLSFGKKNEFYESCGTEPA